MGREAEDDWLTPEAAGRSCGMSAQWAREQIQAGRLVATAWVTGRRVSYRIRREDWHAFLARYGRRTDDQGWDG